MMATIMKAFSGKCDILPHQKTHHDHFDPCLPFCQAKSDSFRGTSLWAAVTNQPFCYGKASFSTKFVILLIFYFQSFGNFSVSCENFQKHWSTLCFYTLFRSCDRSCSFDGKQLLYNNFHGFLGKNGGILTG